MSRRRRSRSKSPEALAAEAREELERAESALRYHKSQLAEAEAELLALEGFGGIFAALLGRKAQYQAEIMERITALKSELLKGRKRLIEARQAVAKVEKAERSTAAARAERDKHLEELANRVRATRSHRLHGRLAELEGQLQEALDELGTYEEALAATLGLMGSIARVAALTRSSKSAQQAETFTPLPFMGQLAFLRRVEVRVEQQSIPRALDRFNAASAVLGLPPLDIRVPDIGVGWEQLFADNLVVDAYRLRKIEQFARRLDDERDIVRENLMWLSTKRKGISERIESHLATRRAMLDEAL